LLFMGQEWAASTPFQYFTDHNEALGRLVTEGRRREFHSWPEFTEHDVPDPQALDTFLHSRLDWEERTAEPHASTLRLYRALLSLRRTEAAFDWSAHATQHARPAGPDAVIVRRDASGAAALVIARLRGEGELAVDASDAPAPRHMRWDLAFTTEDAAFAPDPAPIAVDLSTPETPRVRFSRPGALVLRAIPTS
jgi:maltooligosyltrehalose trehalohydrolase